MSSNGTSQTKQTCLLVSHFVVVDYRNLQCICTIIGTSKWLKQSLLLEDMFSRLGTSPVQSIIDMSANLKEVII